MEYNHRQNDLLIGELTAKVNLMLVSVSKLESRVEDLTEQANKGRGFVFGALLLAGGMGATLSEALGRVFR